MSHYFMHSSHLQRLSFTAFIVLPLLKTQCMKKILLATASLIFSLQIFAQFPGSTTSGKNNQAPPAIGHLYGKLIDSAGKPVDQASVVLLQNKYDSVSRKKKDILLKGLTTDNKGEFSFEDLPVFGALKLKISAVGFKADEQTVSFQPGSFDKDLGNI